jgi:hypothetical protein
MGDKFEVIATNTLEDQMFIATPVIAAGELFLRGQNKLFCISERKLQASDRRGGGRTPSAS